MRYLLIVAMLAGTAITLAATAWGGFLYSPDPDAIIQAIIINTVEPDIEIGESFTDRDTGKRVCYIGGNKWMQCDVLPELLSAAEAVLPYLNESGQIISVYPIYRTPAASLRERADEIEARDAAIKRFRDALKKAKP